MKILMCLALIFVFLGGCSQNSNAKEHFQQWNTGFPSTQEFFERSTNIPRDLDRGSRELWEQAILITWVEMGRLSQSGRDVSFLVKPGNSGKEMRDFIANLPGKEGHRAALAFWILQESFPGTAYSLGIIGQNTAGQRFLALEHRLLNEQAQVLEYFGSKGENFRPLILIRWNSKTNLFDIAIEQNLIRELGSKGHTII